MQHLLLFDFFQLDEHQLIANRKHKTYLGALISLTLVGSLGFVFVSLVQDLAAKTNPNVVFYETQVDIPGPLKLSKDQFLIAFYLRSYDKNATFVDITVFGRLQWMLDNDFKNINFIRCDNDTLSRYRITSEFDLQNLREYGYCLNMTQYDKIQDKLQFRNQFSESADQGINGLNGAFFDLFACREFNNTCLETEINGAILVTDFAVNQQSKNPLQRYYQKTNYAFSFNQYQSEMRHLKQIDFIEYFNPFYFGDQITKLQGYTEQQKQTEGGSYGDPPMGTGYKIIWDLHNVKVTYIRKYGTLLNIVAQISGLYSILKAILKILFMDRYGTVEFSIKLQKILNNLHDVGDKQENQSCQSCIFIMKALIGKNKSFEHKNKLIKENLSIQAILLSVCRLQIMEKILLNQQQSEELINSLQMRFGDPEIPKCGIKCLMKTQCDEVITET